MPRTPERRNQKTEHRVFLKATETGKKKKRLMRLTGRGLLTENRRIKPSVAGTLGREMAIGTTKEIHDDRYTEGRGTAKQRRDREFRGKHWNGKKWV
ncbi:MAG: hypothetical protein PHH08_04900 [Candidatus ainarchaeum sp.]|nr:hypothetical protein [Candidatus ainarchaeum sp.]